ncbi:MAG: GNAT family N-acetyltransferase [Cyanobacteria bacterium J06632_22]
MKIQPYESSHLGAVVQLSMRAWAPVFMSIQTSLNAEVYQAFYPETWQVSQQKAVEDVCAAEDVKVWVAVETEQPVGFVAAKLHPEDKMGEIYMMAVDPDCQGRGIGSALIDHALSWMKETGMAIVMVETGGDPGHAPARRAYESAGFELWPVARYFKSL